MRNVTTLALLLATAVLAVTSSSRSADRKNVRERIGGCQAGTPADWSDAMTSFSAPGGLATPTPCALPLPAHDLVLRTASGVATLEPADDGAARPLAAGGLGGDPRERMVPDRTAPAWQGTSTARRGFARTEGRARADTVQPGR